MKLERTERLQAHTKGKRFSCFLYADRAHDLGDAVFVGAEDGKVSAFWLLENSSKISFVRETDLGKDEEAGTVEHHTGKVNCMMYSNHEKLNSPTSFGLLFTGGNDRVVKVWDSHGIMMQNMPHTGPVMQIADACDGSILTVTMDGYLRAWAPQSGRNMMLNPFFECIFHVNVLPSRVDGWLGPGLAVRPRGYWSCFVGDNEGAIAVYRKPPPDFNQSEEGNASLFKQLKRFAKWEGVHSLGVTSLHVLDHLNMLVSLSMDCTAKLLDPVLGQLMYTIPNRFKCAYTSVCPTPADSELLMVDELGNFCMYDFNKEQLVGDPLTLVAPPRVRKDKILKTHKDPMLGGMCRFRGSDKVLIFAFPEPKRGLTDREPEVLHGMHAHDIDSEAGEVALWRPVLDEPSLREFVGHKGNVVAIAPYVSPHRGQHHSTGKHGHGGAGEEKSGGHKKQWHGHSAHLLGEHSDDDQDSANRGAAMAAIKGDTVGEHRRRHMTERDREVIFQVSNEEQALFSAGDDGFIRCWDQYDRKEAYQFRLKDKAEIACMKMLWDSNSLVTGHEDGTITLWNSDAGTWVTSPHVLHEPLMCITEARNARVHYLVGGDYAGRVAVWNMTSFKVNPSNLPVELAFQGCHDKDEPGILGVAYHEKTDTFITGGTDHTVRVWRLGVESKTTLEAHNYPVCCLQSSEHFVLSGDEGGDIIVWRVIPAPTDKDTGTQHGLPTLRPAVRFFCHDLNVPSPAITTLHEVDAHRAFIAQAGNGTKRTTVVWKLWMQARTTKSKSNVEMMDLGTLSEIEKLHGDMKAAPKASGLSTPTFGGTPIISRAPSRERSRRGTVTMTPERTMRVKEVNKAREGEEEFHLLHNTNPDMYISVIECRTIFHKDMDVSCVSFTDEYATSKKHWKAKASDFGGGGHGLSKAYFGTSQGPVLSYGCQIGSDFGETVPQREEKEEGHKKEVQMTEPV